MCNACKTHKDFIDLAESMLDPLQTSTNLITVRYYKTRNLQRPNAEQALAWMFTEFVELLEADMSYDNESALAKAYPILKYISDNVEGWLMQDGGWTRNMGRLKPKKDPLEEISDEAGDIVMMLSRYLVERGLASPEACMASKMIGKISELPSE